MNNKGKMYFITCIVLLLDQIVKIIVNNCMTLYDEIKIIPNFFSIYYVKNTGAAFSILENNTTFLIFLTVIFILIIHKYIKNETNITKLSSISFGLILGGMFGNLIDRIIHAGVIDYLSFEFFSYGFPIFNIADIGITLGVSIMLIEMLLEKKRVLSTLRYIHIH